jgi:hypothetical protein
LYNRKKQEKNMKCTITGAAGNDSIISTIFIDWIDDGRGGNVNHLERDLINLLDIHQFNQNHCYLKDYGRGLAIVFDVAVIPQDKIFQLIKELKDKETINQIAQIIPINFSSPPSS